MMTIEEAIIHCHEMAAGMVDCGCQKDHQQLAEWLEELADRRKAHPVVHSHWDYSFEAVYCHNCGANPEDFFHTEGYDSVCVNWGDDAPRCCPGCGAIMDEEVTNDGQIH